LFLDWHPAESVFFYAPMKILRLTSLTLALLVAMAFSASAQSKVASVDIKKIFNAYYKTKLATASLDNRKAELHKELKKIADDLEKAQADYKELLDQASDQAMAPDEREKRKTAATAKAREIAASKSSLEQFQRQAEAQLGDESQRMTSNLVTDIHKAVADKARLSGYSMVVNTSLTEAFVYVSPDNDITDAVLAQLNAGAPIDVSKPAGAPLTVSTNQP
jgi:outer membrane protein